MSDNCPYCLQPMPKHRTQSCDECGHKWADGIDGCPKCGDGNPFKGIRCLTPMSAASERTIAAREALEK